MHAPPDPVQKTLEDTPARVTYLAASKIDGKGYLLALEARSIIALRQGALREALAEQDPFARRRLQLFDASEQQCIRTGREPRKRTSRC